MPGTPPATYWTVTMTKFQAPEFLAIAHRGYSERYPENSRSAYEGAIAAGAAYIESDARLSADGEVVSSHDPNFGRVSGNPLTISETHSRDLMALDIGDGQPPMLLTDVLALAAGRVNVLVDVKTDDLVLAGAVLDRVITAGALGSTVVGLRSAEQVRLACARDAGVQCLGFVPDCDDIASFFDAGAIAVRVWEDDIEHPTAVRALKEGHRVWATAGRRSRGEAPGFITPERLAYLQDMGFEAVLLNDPTLITGASA